MLPRDPDDGKDVFVEIRAGAGGDEGDLCRRSGADVHALRRDARDASRGRLAERERSGGYKEIVFAVKGGEPYSTFKFESGVHRVQRVPVTEAQGRVHTSTATVAVLPQAEEDEVEVEIDPKDLANRHV